MADMRISSVEDAGDSLRVGVISNHLRSPIVTGYSDRQPAAVEVESNRLEEASSLERLERQRSGWYWDPQKRLWYVKLDFTDTSEMQTKVFRIF